MTDLLSRQDARIHRCGCGAWVYAAAACPTCAAHEAERRLGLRAGRDFAVRGVA